MNPVVAYLKQGFYPYRVPLFEELSARASAVDGAFRVIALKRPNVSNERIALTMGSFDRQLVSGKYISLTRHHDEGQETPLWLTVAPTLPLALHRSRASVVISDTFTPWTLTAILMGYRVVIFWEGTAHTERTVGPRRAAMRRWMARRARAFVVNGKLSRDYLIEALGVPAERIFVGGLCTDIPPSGTNCEPRLVADDERVRFVTAANLIERKGPRYLIEAAALLERDPATSGRFEVRIVGDGPARPGLEALCASRRVRHCVHFTGYADPADVWSHYGESHVFVLPTLQDNWPLVVPEAMTTGLPVLLSNLAGSVPDLIDAGKNGFAFDPTDARQLAALMARYIGDHGLIRRHGQRSLHVVSAYAPTRIADVYWAAVQSAAADEARRHGVAVAD